MNVTDSRAEKAEHLEKHALQVALLAFRCARQNEEKQDMASEAAVKAYLALRPKDVHASDKVIAAILDAVQWRPHWLALEAAAADTV